MSNIANLDSIDHNFPDSTIFTEKIQTLQNQLLPILDDFAKYYVFYHKNPESNEYQQIFNNIKSNLNNLNSQLFMVSNDVQSNTNSLNEKLLELDNLIKNEKIKNAELKLKLGIVEHKNNAASELITDFKHMYNYGYLRNWGILISIFVAGFTINKVFKK